MKLIICKATKDKQLGHLYEHIFLSALSDRLRNNDYLSFLDYDISGIVDDSGLIVLELKFKDYLKDAIENFLHQQKIVFSDDAIASAALQIFAEKMVDSDGFENSIIDELEKLEAQKWQKVSIINQNKIRSISNDSFLNLYSVDESDFFNDVIKFSFQIENEADFKKLPLFYYLSRILVNSSSEMIENDFHAFCLSVDDQFNDNIYTASATLRTSRRQNKDLTQKKLEIEKIIDLLKTKPVLKRMAEDLQKSIKLGELPINLDKLSADIGKNINKEAFEGLVSEVNLLATINKVKF